VRDAAIFERPVLGQREIRLAQDAAEWRLLSLLFECPTPEWRVQVTALMHEVTDADLKSAAQDAVDEASEGLFHHTFGAGGPAPPREATYHQTVQLGYFIVGFAGVLQCVSISASHQRAS